MTDPFDALRSPVEPVEPDPVFAARLRSRVERALTLPKGVVVSQTTIESHGPRAATRAGGGPDAGAATGLVPYLIVADARRAIEWYEEVFGARRRGEPMVMSDGRVGHAEIALGPALLFLADESPESHVASPWAGADATVSLLVEVPDVDTTVARAVGAGAEVERPAADNPYGRTAVVRDPFHHRWIVSAAPPVGATSAPDGDESERQGDVGYASLQVPDVERAEAFFTAVLGWTYEPGSAPQGRQVQGVAPHQGLWGGVEHATLFLCFAVDDVDEAVERVRAAGGQAGEPDDRPYGRLADCVDNQGTPFALYRAPVGARAGRIARHGTNEGDLAYVTMEVIDSHLARAFYGAVLGWSFGPGHVDDGWQLQDTRPGMGLRGGVDVATVVPMYRVDDIDAAVARVRDAGGSATDPERQPYGVTSTCTDDQGTRFSLGQL